MNSLKRSCYLIFSCLIAFLITNAQQKSFQVVPYQQPGFEGIDGEIFNWNDTLFFAFPQSQYANKLGKFSGGRIQVLSDPDNNSQVKIVGGFSVRKNNLHFVTGVNKRYLSFFNRADSTIKQFANPDNGYGQEPKAYLFKGEVYYLYKNGSDNICLVKLTDSGLKFVSTPANTYIFDVYTDSDYMIFNVADGVIKFDGVTVNYIKGTTDNFHIEANIVKSNNRNYTVIENPNYNERLAEITNTEFIIIDGLPALSRVNSNLATFGGKVYFNYEYEKSAAEFVNNFASYDGQFIKIELADCKKRLDLPWIEYKGDFYFKTVDYLPTI